MARKPTKAKKPGRKPVSVPANPRPTAGGLSSDELSHKRRLQRLGVRPGPAPTNSGN